MKNKNQDFFDAIFCNKLEEIKELAQDWEVKFSHTTSYGQNALHLAAAVTRNPEILKLIVEKAKNSSMLEKFDKEGFTPLMYSVMHQNKELTELLLKEGIEILRAPRDNNNTNFKETALTISAKYCVDQNNNYNPCSKMVLEAAYKQGMLDESIPNDTLFYDREVFIQLLKNLAGEKGEFFAKMLEEVTTPNLMETGNNNSPQFNLIEIFYTHQEEDFGDLYDFSSSTSTSTNTSGEPSEILTDSSEN
jgi:ankyrin repeat protein